MFYKLDQMAIQPTEVDIKYEALKILNEIISATSIFGALVIIVTLSALGLYDKRLVDRISLRLCFGISVIDVIRAIGMMLYLRVQEEGPKCQASAMLIHFSILSHMMLSVMIALNLQLIFINQIRPRPVWHIMYWFLGIGLPMIITLTVYFLGGFGFDTIGEVCFYRKVYVLGDSGAKALVWAGFLSWNIVGTIYCLVIAGLTVYHLREKSKLLDSFFNKNEIKPGYQNKVSKKSIELLIARICFYCIVPLITQFGCVLGLIWEQNNGDAPYWISVVDIIGTNLSGTLNLTGFLVDPALRNALSCVYQDLTNTESTRSFGESSESNESESDNKNIFEKHPHPWICNVFYYILVKKEFLIGKLSLSDSGSSDDHIKQPRINVRTIDSTYDKSMIEKLKKGETVEIDIPDTCIEMQPTSKPITQAQFQVVDAREDLTSKAEFSGLSLKEASQPEARAPSSNFHRAMSPPYYRHMNISNVEENSGTVNGHAPSEIGSQTSLRPNARGASQFAMPKRSSYFKSVKNL